MSTMKNLYLIGNGFDKHHDIPSGYWDFHDWLIGRNPDLVERIDELYGYNGDLWGNFEVELGNLDVASTATEIYREHPADLLSDHYEQTYHEGSIVAGDTIGEIYNKIREQFPTWVRDLPEANPVKRINLQDDAFYITFNYTDTLIDLYNIPLKDILFIHGRAKEDKFLVLGHGKPDEQVAKESEKDFNENTESAYMETVYAIERQLRMMRKKTEQIIKDNLSVFESIKDVEHIFAYGLSMSEVDKLYFDEIVHRIEPATVKWTVDAFGKTPEEIEKNGQKKISFLESIGVPKDMVSVCTLEDLRRYKENPLF